METVVGSETVYQGEGKMTGEHTTETRTLATAYSSPTVCGNEDIVVNRQDLIDERACLLARIDQIEKIIGKTPRTSELRCVDDLAKRKR